MVHVSSSPGPQTTVRYILSSLTEGVLKEVDAIQWEPPLQRPATIHLTNGDESLLPHAQELAVNVPVGFKQMAFSVTEPAKPGKGYILVMKDSGNGTSEYKESTADGKYCLNLSHSRSRRMVLVLSFLRLLLRRLSRLLLTVGGYG